IVFTQHKRLATDPEKRITENFGYDAQNRLLTHTHQIDNNPVEVLTQNKYNELSQLEFKKVGGANAAAPLQQIDYKYNIRGWMTQINDPSALGTDLFGYSIKYNNPLTENWTPRYNGNISEIDWVTKNDNVVRRYVYMYDSVNRLTGGYYLEPNNSVIWAGYFNENYNYDLNGNITKLTRMGKSPTAQNTSLLIDDLTYTYTGNRLSTVADASQNTSGYPYFAAPNVIGYDNNGNMTIHKDKGINEIKYNFLNLPNKYSYSYGSYSYKYRADGVKIEKESYYIIPNSTYKVSYLDGFQYSDYSDQTFGLDFVPTSEGYFNFRNNKYIYNYTDHLGNVRLSYQKGTSGIEVIEENNYYPFGLKHEGYNSLPGSSVYQYKYNGKELQETGMYDYGARFYMPDLGRWGVVDPLAEKSRRFSPYNYALDNPLMFIDPDGMEAKHIDPSAIFEKNKDGSYKNPKLVQSWNAFATSKEGIAFLKDYASPGQKIAGVEYSDKGGKYHNKGMDLSFDSGKSLANYNKGSFNKAVGITDKISENGRINFRVSIEDRAFTDQTLETLTHELGIHVKLGSMDYFDNKKFDFSSGYESIKGDGYTSSYLNNYYGESTSRSTNVPDHMVDKKTNQAYNLGAPILRSFYQKLNIKRTDAQIKNLYNN
ncbi:RHS repeat domain-containing protein, partial [Chryseobacterium paridis]